MLVGDASATLSLLACDAELLAFLLAFGICAFFLVVLIRFSAGLVCACVEIGARVASVMKLVFFGCRRTGRPMNARGWMRRSGLKQERKKVWDPARCPVATKKRTAPTTHHSHMYDCAHLLAVLGTLRSDQAWVSRRWECVDKEHTRACICCYTTRKHTEPAYYYLFG